MLSLVRLAPALLIVAGLAPTLATPLAAPLAAPAPCPGKPLPPLRQTILRLPVPFSAPLTVPLDPNTRDRIDTFPTTPSVLPASPGRTPSDPTIFGPSAVPAPMLDDPATHDRFNVSKPSPALAPPGPNTSPLQDTPVFARSPFR